MSFVHQKNDNICSAVVPVSMQELLWYDEVLAAELRTGEASSFADR